MAASFLKAAMIGDKHKAFQSVMTDAITLKTSEEFHMPRYGAQRPFFLSRTSGEDIFCIYDPELSPICIGQKVRYYQNGPNAGNIIYVPRAYLDTVGKYPRGATIDNVPETSSIHQPLEVSKDSGPFIDWRVLKEGVFGIFTHFCELSSIVETFTLDEISEIAFVTGVVVTRAPSPEELKYLEHIVTENIYILDVRPEGPMPNMIGSLGQEWKAYYRIDAVFDMGRYVTDFSSIRICLGQRGTPIRILNMVDVEGKVSSLALEALFQYRDHRSPDGVGLSDDAQDLAADYAQSREAGALNIASLVSMGYFEEINVFVDYPALENLKDLVAQTQREPYHRWDLSRYSLLISPQDPILGFNFAQLDPPDKDIVSKFGQAEVLFEMGWDSLEIYIKGTGAKMAECLAIMTMGEFSFFPLMKDRGLFGTPDLNMWVTNPNHPLLTLM